MAILKVKQIRETAQDGLSKKLSELKLELLKEQGNVKMGRPIKNPGKIRVLKRTIARVATIQQERKLKEVKK
ncbi:MAG: 50S ribosomal protein L29 [Candidatus Aenigmarchaeota archaeon]|nr:50S ribosomal protein L29 [Candidatus Aenigmarchaeota archaeon]